jgi:hypothetical protein
MDDGQMTAAVASSDDSREEIEKKEGRDEREGTWGRSSLMMEGEGGVKVAQRTFVGEFRDGTLDGKCVAGLEPLMHILANNAILVLLN